jgi:protein phosphatase 1B
MGAFLEKPNTNKHNETGEGNGLRYGVSSMQGETFKNFMHFLI